MLHSVTQSPVSENLSVCLQVLVHWACQKINASLQQPDNELKEVLRGKLQKYRGIRYSLIAGHAESVGRKGLATLLLEHETCAADQVCTHSEHIAGFLNAQTVCCLYDWCFS